MPIKRISGNVSVPKTKLKGVHLKTNRISQKPTIIKSYNNSKVATIKMHTVSPKKPTSVKSVTASYVNYKKSKSATPKSTTYKVHEPYNKSPRVIEYATNADFENYNTIYHRLMDKTLYYYKKYNLQIQEEKPPTAKRVKELITKIDNGKVYYLKRDFNRYYRKLEDLYNNIREKKFIDEELLMSSNLELMIAFYNFRNIENNTGGPYVVRPELKRGQTKQEAVDELCERYGLNNRWRYFLTMCTYTKEHTFDNYKKIWRR